jgi:metal-responsive CopG/Arc/MetJ family transcriptional regulator
MNTITVRLPDQLFQELDSYSKKLKISRALYVRKALEHLNREMETQRRRERLKKVSLKIRNESLRVNAEFSEIEAAPNV